MLAPSSNLETVCPATKIPPAITPFEPIAIVGVGIHAPGGIDSLSGLWDTIIQGKSHHAHVASDPRFLRRFNPDDFETLFSLIPRENLYANLLDESPGLDEEYFGYTKRQSTCMEAQLKALLHVAHEALEDAGFTGRADGSALDPANVGVYIGAAADQFSKDLTIYPIDLYNLTSNQRAFMSGQISHKFGLHGPSVSVDTACSSSMTALNDACRALATRECNAALAGGVHIMSPVSAPAGVLSLRLAGLLETKGQCQPFLASGNGYCSSETCGLAVLKRLSDAIRDGDRIYGVIQGFGVGNMSSEASILCPESHLESAILAKAIASSGIDPKDISFVEAHGPGTKKGDPAELSAVCSVLAQSGSRSASNPLIIGSVKGNVGHSEAASGATSLFKVLAMMRHQKIPPQANFHPSKLNPDLRPFFDHHPIAMVSTEQDWNASRRIAIVSNFGASGYAGYMVVEEPSSFVLQAETLEGKVSSLPFIISAKNEPTLSILAQRYADWLDGEGASGPLSGISYSTTARRELHRYFVLLQAKSHADLAQQLRQNWFQAIDKSLLLSRSLAFCFSGQGGPRVDPRQTTFYGASAAFSSTVDECFKLAESEQLFAPDDIEVLELFALQIGLARMWTAWGIRPVAFAGHSFGEYATLVCASVLSLQDALKLIGVRASLVREKCTEPPSRMAALGLPLAVVRELLDQQQTTRVELACINSENRLALAGTLEDLEAFRQEVLKVYPTARWQLIDNMRAAFHSRFVEPLCEEFSRACKEVTLHPSQAVILSGPLGRTCLPGDEALLQPDYLVQHCRETNSFGKAILDYKHHNDCAGESQPDWIELGPHSTTVGFMPQLSGQLKLASLHKDGDGWTTTLDTLTKLRTEGHAIDFLAFHRDINPTARHVDLPRYPLHPQPHTYPVKTYPIPNQQPIRIQPIPTIEKTTNYPRITSAEVSSILKNHVVANRPTCPVSIYMALVFAACVDGHKAKSTFRLTQLELNKPFTSLTGDWLQARTSPSPTAARSTFDVISKSDDVHASMQVEICQETALLDSLKLLKPLVLSLQSIKDHPGTNVLDGRLAHDLWSQTVHYGPQCKGLRRVWVSEDGYQACALFSNNPDEAAQRRALEPSGLQHFSPILVDQAYQLLSLLVNTSPARERKQIFVPREIDQVEIAVSKVRDSISLESYASFEFSDGHGGAKVVVGQVFTFDQDQRLVAAFRGVSMYSMQIATSPTMAAVDTTGIPNPRAGPGSLSPPLTPVSNPTAYSDLAPSSTSLSLTQVGEESTDDQLRKRVSDIVGNALGTDKVLTDRKLTELGLDSLCAVEIIAEIGRLIPDRKLPNELLAKSETTLETVFGALHLSSSAKPSSPTFSASSPPPSVPKDQVGESDDQLRNRVSEIVKTALGMDDISTDRKLTELGVDSLCAVEIIAELGRLLPDRKLPSDLLAKSDTTIVTIFEALHLSSAQPTSAAPTNGSTILDYIGANPELIQDRPGNTVLLLIHDSGGTALAYRLLGDVGCTVIGIHSPGLREGRGIVSIRHAADQYASLARQWLERSSRRSAQFLVGGWSLGGGIALALASAHPDIVSGVVLLDPKPPGTAHMTPEESERLVPAAAAENQRSRGFGTLVRSQLKMNALSLRADPDVKAGAETIFQHLKAPVYLVNATEPLDGRDAKESSTPGSSSEWMLGKDRAITAERVWKKTLGNLLVGTQRTAGDHFSMFTRANAESTTRAVRKAVAALETTFGVGRV
ncbi:ketoacyl-synt-domain-containing protein [Ramaria rubella]|nr:ketoacyl-synt-domain-containing protein [Ramaria rubella]